MFNFSDKKMDLEDVFDQSEEAEKRDFDRQFEKYTSKFVKAGFRNALENEETNEEVLQNAFDKGYEFGFQKALEFNQFRLSHKMIELMLVEGRLLASEEEKEEQEPAFRRLQSFSQKLEKIQTKLVQRFQSITKSEDVEQIQELIQLPLLKSESNDILKDLNCPIKI